jgi:alpha-mannosidase
MIAALLMTTLALPGTSFAQNPTEKTARPVQASVDVSKDKTLFLVGYAHLDTQWRWAYPQVIREFLRDTLRNNFTLMEKYPNYIFNFSGSRRYEMMKEYYPEDYLKVKQYVKEGRWFPAGSSVDEGDANVPSAEAIIRHNLYGNHFFKQEFGVVSQEFMLPDCFGFPYALPTILTHSGITGFSTQKLTWGSAIGIPFKVGNWEGPDGKRVLAALDPGAYVHDITEDLSQNTSWLARIQNTGKTSGAFVDYHYYGVGDRGGAPGPESVSWVEKSLKGTGPLKVVSSRADEMFLAIKPEQKAKLPVYKGEMLLTEHSAGSITSQAYMKRWNRHSELLANSAERAAAAAMWLGGPRYPSNRIYQAWNLVLGSQMHDILPGTSLPKAYEFSWNDEVLAQNQFAAIASDSVAAITSAMDTQAKGTAVAVYNPLAVARQDIVEATISVAGNTARGVRAYGPDGKPVPTQVLSRSGNQVRLLFLANVPSTSLVTYDVRPEAAPAGTGTLKAANNVLENDYFKVTIDANGDISSIYDKVNKQEALKAPARLALAYHNPGQFPAWNMDWADVQKPPRAFVGGPVKVRVVEAGPVRVAIEIVRETDGSHYTQQVRLSAGTAGRQVEVANKIDWQTRVSALKASFPLTTGNPKATYDLQVGAIERTNNDPKKYEVPQHQWFDLTKPDSSYGVAVLNDSKYGSDKPDDDTMRLTLLYTPGVRGGYQDEATQDFGRHDIRYAIAPHAGDWRKGDVPWLAKRFNSPLVAFAVPAHAGKLGKSFSFVSANTKQVEISSVKKAEDSDEIIVRLRELEGKPAANVQIKMAGQIVAAREVDGQERPLGKVAVQNGTLVTSVSAYSLKAFAITLAKSPAKAAPVQTTAVSLSYDLDAASRDKSLTDGAFDKEGRTFPGEQLPTTVLAGNISFKLGSTANGAKNAVTSKGQTISLPAGYSRVYLLAASSEGDIAAPFTLGGKPVTTTVQDWGGYVGQWDNRLWLGKVPELTYDWHNPWGGLVPGYIKKSEVAWFASHRHHPQAGNEYYQYSYLFKYGFDIPRGATSIKLPNDPRIKVFAVTVAKETNTQIASATPLHDTLNDRDGGRTPRIVAGSGPFNDVTTVTLEHPLYWRAGGLHYTLDGSTPTASSPVYSAPLELNDRVTIKAAEIDAAGKAGPVAVATLDIQDTTAPKLVAAEFVAGQSQMTLRFTENLDKASAAQAANYRLNAEAQVKTALLLEDSRSVYLTLDRPLPTGTTPAQMTVSGVKDTAPKGNPSASETITLTPLTPIYTGEASQPGTVTRTDVAGLPAKAGDPWTMNLYVKVDQQPEDRTLIAGFGRPRDGASGRGRYLAKFGDGIRFWSANQDVSTDVALDLGKWQMLTATYDGKTLRMYKNGTQIGSREIELSDDRPEVNITPKDAWDNTRQLAGEVRKMTVWKQALTPAAVQQIWEQGKTP